MSWIVNIFRMLCHAIKRGWWFVVQITDLLILVRIPLLAGVAAVAYVPQLHELFEISLSSDAGRGSASFAFLFSAGLALVV